MNTRYFIDSPMRMFRKWPGVFLMGLFVVIYANASLAQDHENENKVHEHPSDMNASEEDGNVHQHAPDMETSGNDAHEHPSDMEHAEEDVHEYASEQDGSGEHVHESHDAESGGHIHPPAQETPNAQSVGVDEKPGEYIPLDVSFLDEQGQPIRLGDFISKPTILLPVYYTCPQACNMMLADLASALNEVPVQPGKDFRVLAFSFDDEETPEMAKEAKSEYFRILKSGFPEGEWTFLTGKMADIRQVTDALGYRFSKTGKHSFLHPNVLMVLAADGKIIRYLYGLDFLPFDIGMALSEAEKGTPGLSIRKLMTYCFDYDPENKRYVFKTFRIVGGVTILLAVIFFVFLIRPRKKSSS